MYKRAFTNTLVEHEGQFCVYNWLLGEYVCFDDPKHPFLSITLNNVENFEKFTYKNSYDDFNWLMEKRFIVSDDSVIREIISDEFKENSRKLSITLLPADNACNFRCKYCYENHDFKNYMGKAEKKVLLKFLTKSEIDYLNLEFFGGEPLLNKEFIIDISRDILNLKTIKYSGSITTNGFLLDEELFRTFLNLNITSYQITLDGLEEDHNNLRPLSGGKGTYQTILNNLKKISLLNKSYLFDIIIRVNFNSNTATEQKRNLFLTEILNILGNDNRFSFIFRPIGDYMSANNHTVLNKQEFLCAKNEQIA